MSSLTKENIPHLCRACLRKLNENGLSNNERKQGPAYYHIDRTNHLHKWMVIINPLEDVTRLKNNEHHKQFPQYVCRSCYENFKHLNDFKEMVVHSFSVFTKLLATDEEKKQTQMEQPKTKNDLAVKSEPIDNDDNNYIDDDDDNDDDDDDDDEDDNDDFDDEYMDNDWQTNNEVLNNETDMDLLEANLSTINAAQRKRKYRETVKMDQDKWLKAREKQRQWSRQWRIKNKLECEKDEEKRRVYREKERLRKRRQREQKKLMQMQQQNDFLSMAMLPIFQNNSTNISNKGIINKKATQVAEQQQSYTYIKAEPIDESYFNECYSDSQPCSYKFLNTCKKNQPSKNDSHTKKKQQLHTLGDDNND